MRAAVMCWEMAALTETQEAELKMFSLGGTRIRNESLGGIRWSRWGFRCAEEGWWLYWTKVVDEGAARWEGKRKSSEEVMKGRCSDPLKEEAEIDSLAEKSRRFLKSFFCPSAHLMLPELSAVGQQHPDVNWNVLGSILTGSDVHEQIFVHLCALGVTASSHSSTDATVFTQKTTTKPF